MGLLDIFSKPKNDPMAKYSARIYFLAEKGADEIRKLAELLADKGVIKQKTTWFRFSQNFRMSIFT